VKDRSLKMCGISNGLLEDFTVGGPHDVYGRFLLYFPAVPVVSR